MLHRVAKGDLYARVTGSSSVELSKSLKKVTNEMIENIDREITERKRAEQQLRKSEERSGSFLENFQGIAFRSTLDLQPIFFHGIVEQITGYTSEEFMGGQIRWDQVIHPVDIDHIPGTAELKSIPNMQSRRNIELSGRMERYAGFIKSSGTFVTNPEFHTGLKERSMILQTNNPTSASSGHGVSH